MTVGELKELISGLDDHLRIDIKVQRIRPRAEIRSGAYIDHYVSKYVNLVLDDTENFHRNLCLECEIKNI